MSTILSKTRRRGRELNEEGAAETPAMSFSFRRTVHGSITRVGDRAGTGCDPCWKGNLLPWKKEGRKRAHSEQLARRRRSG